MEYLQFLDLKYSLANEYQSDHTPKNQPLLCQRSNSNEWAQSAGLGAAKCWWPLAV